MPKSTNMLRRLVCLPPLEIEPEEEVLSPAMPAPLRVSLAAAQAEPIEPKPVEKDPHTLRKALYPIVLLYTAAFLGLELREFLFGTASRFLSPEMYTGLLAAFAGEHEIRRWTGKTDRYALSAEFVIYAWWLSYLVILLWINLRAGCTRVMPADYAAICKEIIVVFFGAGVSKFFHAQAADSDAAALSKAKQAIMDYAAGHGRITTGQCAQLLGVSVRHARRLISQLQAEGLLEPDGSKDDPGYRPTGNSV